MTQKTKKNSAARKLVPAAGMLAVSAMMLATSTYAWFTMAREVEVTNIQMTASVPADLQISLGMLGGLGNAEDSHGLVDNWGTLVPAEGASADNGGVAAPTDDARYWSNTADISAYYALGRIMPASSTDGKAVFFTPDATGVGKTLKANAAYYTAVQNATIARDANGNSYMTTLHAYNSKTGSTVGDTWSSISGVTSNGYVKATEYDKTNDDGYFVDIPVWIRSSSTEEDIHLSVDAYVTTKSKNDDDDLYLAARAVILGAEKNTTSGLIEIKKDSYGTAENPGDSIVDFMSTTNSTGAAVASLSDTTANYGAETYYDGTIGNSQVTVPASTVEGKYGDSAKIWIRVWLEGEDPNCWNENAGQDFNISLKFSRENVTLPTTHHFTPTVAATDNATLNAGVTTQVNFEGGLSMTYTYNGTTWRAGSTFNAAPLGSIWKIGETVITDETVLAEYIRTHITNNDLAASGLNVTTESVGLPERMTVTVARAAGATANTLTWSAELPDDGITSISLSNGKTYASESEIVADTDLDAGSYTATISYNGTIQTYTVTYPTVTVASAHDSTKATIKFMRIDTATPATPAVGETEAQSETHSYKWFIAPDNTYQLVAGYGVKYGDADTVYTNFATLIDAINSSTVPEEASEITITEVASEVSTPYTITITNAPTGKATLKLVKTVSGNSTTWSEASSEGYTAWESIKGSKLAYNNTLYTSLTGDNGLLGALTSETGVPAISWVYNYEGDFTVSKTKNASGHYDFTSNDATFPINFTAYTFTISGESSPVSPCTSLADLEAALDTYFATDGAGDSVTVTTSTP